MSAANWGDVPRWAYDAAMALMQSLKTVDPTTYKHCLRVGEMSRKLARDAGLNEYEQKVAEFSGLFHDLGKMGVSHEIVGKPGKLDPHEQDIMRNHPKLSEMIVQPLAQNHVFFQQLLPGIRGHHERMDGEGYPDKLMGEKISPIARIILVVDTYDAMSQTRSYRKGLPDEIVFSELKRCSGTQFDPQLVRVFLQAIQTWKKNEFEAETVEKLHKRVA